MGAKIGILLEFSKFWGNYLLVGSAKEGVTTFWDVAAGMGQLVCKVRFALITSDIVRQLHRNLPGGDADLRAKVRK